MFLILHLYKLCIREFVCEPQLWERGRVGVPQGDQSWEADRKAKSLAFLGKDEDKVLEQDNNSVDSEEPEKKLKFRKKRNSMLVTKTVLTRWLINISLRGRVTSIRTRISLCRSTRPMARGRSLISEILILQR